MKKKNWHYVTYEQVLFKKDDDPRNGWYLCYDVDTFDYLLNSNDWAYNNHAIEERDYILSMLDGMIESNDGSFVFIPNDPKITGLENSWEASLMDAGF